MTCTVFDSDYRIAVCVWCRDGNVILFAEKEIELPIPPFNGLRIAGEPGVSEEEEDDSSEEKVYELGFLLENLTCDLEDGTMSSEVLICYDQLVELLHSTTLVESAIEDEAASLATAPYDWENADLEAEVKMVRDHMEANGWTITDLHIEE